MRRVKNKTAKSFFAKNIALLDFVCKQENDPWVLSEYSFYFIDLQVVFLFKRSVNTYIKTDMFFWIVLLLIIIVFSFNVTIQLQTKIEKKFKKPLFLEAFKKHLKSPVSLQCY
jgi:hypothetical protein